MPFDRGFLGFFSFSTSSSESSITITSGSTVFDFVPATDVGFGRDDEGPADPLDFGATHLNGGRRFVGGDDDEIIVEWSAAFCRFTPNGSTLLSPVLFTALSFDKNFDIGSLDFLRFPP